MRFKTKNDINYFKFVELTERIIDEEDTIHVLEEASVLFETKEVGKFALALTKEGRLKRRFKLDLDFEKEGGAGRFIDADTFKTEGDVENFLRVILKPKRKWFFWRYDVIKDLSLREAEYVLYQWSEYTRELKEKYEYVYNPPVRYSEPGKTTQGSIERRNFAEHYGGYMEMTYLLTQGKALDEEKVWSWGISRFLFRGEYALRKKEVENMK